MQCPGRVAEHKQRLDAPHGAHAPTIFLCSGRSHKHTHTHTHTHINYQEGLHAAVINSENGT